MSSYWSLVLFRVSRAFFIDVQAELDIVYILTCSRSSIHRQYPCLDRPISHAGGRLACISISCRARKFFSTTQTLRTIQLHPVQLHKQSLHSFPICIGLSPPIQALSSTRELSTARWCKIRASTCTSRPTVISASGTGARGAKYITCLLGQSQRGLHRGCRW